jgi:hypothetical protein
MRWLVLVIALAGCDGVRCLLQLKCPNGGHVDLCCEVEDGNPHSSCYYKPSSGPKFDCVSLDGGAIDCDGAQDGSAGWCANQ